MSLSESELSKQFISLLEVNKGILYKVARTYAREEEEIKDLIQEISIQVWKSFPKFKSDYKFSTWLYRIALNVAISNLRKESKRTSSTEPISARFIQIAAPPDDPQNEQINQLYQVIGELKSFDRALMLLYLEEKSYVEIADILGISESNVATKLNRLKKILKEKILKLNQL